jgi:hypothetical protein
LVVLQNQKKKTSVKEMTVSSLLYSLLKTPIKLVVFAGTISKNTLYIMALVLLLGWYWNNVQQEIVV